MTEDSKVLMFIGAMVLVFGGFCFGIMYEKSLYKAPIEHNFALVCNHHNSKLDSYNTNVFMCESGATFNVSQAKKHEK